MTSLQALGICTIISLSLSAVLLATISRPLRRFVERFCPGQEAVGFWLRFTLVMLCLTPLFVAVTFGLPAASRVAEFEPGQLIQQIMTASIFGAFLAMAGIGFWVSALARRAPPLPRSAADPNEFWGDRAKS